MSCSEVIECGARGVGSGGDADAGGEHTESTTDGAEPEALATEEELASVG